MNPLLINAESALDRAVEHIKKHRYEAAKATVGQAMGYLAEAEPERSRRLDDRLRKMRRDLGLTEHRTEVTVPAGFTVSLQNGAAMVTDRRGRKAHTRLSSRDPDPQRTVDALVRELRGEVRL